MVSQFDISQADQTNSASLQTFQSSRIEFNTQNPVWATVFRKDFVIFLVHMGHGGKNNVTNFY